jgi:hypothetical protein
VALAGKGLGLGVGDAVSVGVEVGVADEIEQAVVTDQRQRTKSAICGRIMRT